jgi:hypothetical protein
MNVQEPPKEATESATCSATVEYPKGPDLDRSQIIN